MDGGYISVLDHRLGWVPPERQASTQMWKMAIFWVIPGKDFRRVDKWDTQRSQSRVVNEWVVADSCCWAGWKVQPCTKEMSPLERRVWMFVYQLPSAVSWGLLLKRLPPWSGQSAVCRLNFLLVPERGRPPSGTWSQCFRSWQVLKWHVGTRDRCRQRVWAWQK